jgi:hypothetical protein
MQVDKMLTQLGVMQRAAHNVDITAEADFRSTSGSNGAAAAAGSSSSAARCFGHLHIVFRDWYVLLVLYAIWIYSLYSICE